MTGSSCNWLLSVGHIRGPTQKTRLTPQFGKKEWEGRDKQTATEFFLTCHSVTSFSSIALLSTSERNLKYRRVLIFGRKMSDCKNETEEIHDGKF